MYSSTKISVNQTFQHSTGLFEATWKLIQIRLITEVIVHLAKHFGNILVLLVLLSKNWRHVPDHHLARILSWKQSQYLKKNGNNPYTPDLMFHNRMIKTSLCIHLKPLLRNEKTCYGQQNKSEAVGGHLVWCETDSEVGVLKLTTVQ